jgi:hypothetical protein
VHACLQGLQAAGPSGDALTLTCQSGIARTTLHIGDIRQGRALALQIGTPQLCRECGAILEGMSQLQVANPNLWCQWCHPSAIPLSVAAALQLRVVLASIPQLTTQQLCKCAQHVTFINVLQCAAEGMNISDLDAASINVKKQVLALACNDQR